VYKEKNERRRRRRRRRKRNINAFCERSGCIRNLGTYLHLFLLSMLAV